jgi:hypothetical protein
MSHWGPEDLAQRRAWAVRLDDVAAYLDDPDARLSTLLRSLTVAWEVLDLSRIHRSMWSLEELADEWPRAEFFAASRRLPIELLRQRCELVPGLLDRARRAAAQAAIPDAGNVLHGMRGYASYFTDDADGCAAEAPVFGAFAVDFGVAVVRAEGA